MRKVIEKIPLRKSRKFDWGIFENISYSHDNFGDHELVAKALKDKNPYTITVIIDSLKWEYRNRKEFVKKTKYPRESKFKELLFEYFFEEYGRNGGNEKYGEFLEKYRFVWKKEGNFKDIDEYIIKKELEKRYREKILARFKNKEELFNDRVRIERERYYNLPEPLNYVDWRNPHDNIFVWNEKGKKLARKGGSGSSGGREANSIFIFGLLKLNEITPVPSYLS